MQSILLRLHRWLTLIFALPLLVVIGTGLILSFQPIVHTLAITPGSLSLDKVNALIAKYDPTGKARGLSIDAWEQTLTLDGVGEDGSVDIDLRNGAEAQEDGLLSQWFSESRRLHQRLIFRLRWLVDLSTAAMLVIAGLGIAMGWPRLRNNLSGWHKGIAWILLPLVILSPLTGLLLAFNVTFAGSFGPRAPSVPRSAGASIALPDALQMVARTHDLSDLVSIGNRGGRMLARVNDGGRLRAYAITPAGLVEGGANWPRALHEGNWAGVWSGAANVVTSMALLGLLGTGLLIWARRTFRRRASRTAANLTPPSSL